MHRLARMGYLLLAGYCLATAGCGVLGNEAPPESAGVTASEGNTREVEQAVCIHDKCEDGKSLDSSCDACVSSICAVDPYCCNTYWDAQCVQAVSTICGQPQACLAFPTITCPWSRYRCATWGRVGPDFETNYVLTPSAGGSFSYAGIDDSCCSGTDMTRQPGFLCPKQPHPDGSCAYNVGDGYGTISYRYPNQCSACD